MQYYNEIREKLLNNEITKRVKDYSKNKSELDTYYNGEYKSTKYLNSSYYMKGK